MSEIRFSDLMRKIGPKEANINSGTSEVLCPTCKKGNFKIFRRDKVSEEIYLNHCKCEECAQLFIYKVDKKNSPIFGKR